MDRSKYLGWIDLEMTGLDASRDQILEIATLVTDADLKVIAHGPNLVLHQPGAVLENMIDLVRELHTRSGLLDLVHVSQISLAQAEAQVVDFFKEYAAPFTMPLCGSSIWQDKFFLINHMPSLVNFFHYRLIDVSSIKELVCRWYGAPEFVKKKNHRALDDILESVAELKFYRQNYFVP